jgi:transcriptional regulator with PAS, ATPase and Fis domain
MVRDKTFREDLLYRINTIQIELPPLRQRIEDIEILVNFFAGRYGGKYKKDEIRIAPSAMDKLRNYPWPGNIRELQHTIEKAVILCEQDTIGTDDLYLSKIHVSKVNENITLGEMEERMIREELEEHSDNLSLAAKNLGISRPTLYKKMKKYGL